jgi:hypothetical protein
MKNKIVAHFYVRKEKKNMKGEVPIYLRITVNGERASISTDRSVNLELWDKAAERINGGVSMIISGMIMKMRLRRI